MTNLQQIIKEKQEEKIKELRQLPQLYKASKGDIIAFETFLRTALSDYTKSILAGVRGWAEQQSLRSAEKYETVDLDDLRAFINSTNQEKRWKK